MEISSNGINQPVSFYTKNTGNTINMAIDEDNRVLNGNIFASEFSVTATKPLNKPSKRKRKNKRLNTYDTDYLPDEPGENDNSEVQKENFFITVQEKKFSEKFKQRLLHIIRITPVINYFILKNKTKKIKKTVEELTDINQNVDDMLNTKVPFGEESKLYTDIAKNLTTAANIIGKANRNL